MRFKRWLVCVLGSSSGKYKNIQRPWTAGAIRLRSRHRERTDTHFVWGCGKSGLFPFFLFKKGKKMATHILRKAMDTIGFAIQIVSPANHGTKTRNLIQTNRGLRNLALGLALVFFFFFVVACSWEMLKHRQAQNSKLPLYLPDGGHRSESRLAAQRWDEKILWSTRKTIWL